MHIYQIDRLSNKTEQCTKKYDDSQDAPLSLFFFFFSIWNLEYKVDPSFPETSMHNEWLVNLMYATVESFSACGRPCFRLGWDHNEAIFLTDFSMCWSSVASEPLAHLCCFQCAGTGVSARVMEGSPGLPLVLTTAETSSRSFNY